MDEGEKCAVGLQDWPRLVVDGQLRIKGGQQPGRAVRPQMLFHQPVLALADSGHLLQYSEWHAGHLFRIG